METLTLRIFLTKIMTLTFLRAISEKKIVTALTPIPKSYFDFNRFQIFVHLILFLQLLLRILREAEFNIEI